MESREAYRALIAARPELFENPEGAPFEILTDEAAIREAELARATELKHHPEYSLDWARVGIVFKDQYLMILRDAIRFRGAAERDHNGKPPFGTYIRSVERYPDICGVVMLPVWQGKVLLVEHFRHATRSWHLEIPRGFGMSADSVDSARRELEEEVGAVISRLVQLGETYPDSGAGTGRVAIFFAELDAYGKPELREGIRRIVPTPVAEFETMIRDGKLTDGFMLIAYGLVKAKGLL
jgi:ADP-ribose pyrophosphatase